MVVQIGKPRKELEMDRMEREAPNTPEVPVADLIAEVQQKAPEDARVPTSVEQAKFEAMHAERAARKIPLGDYEVDSKGNFKLLEPKSSAPSQPRTDIDYFVLAAMHYPVVAQSRGHCGTFAELPAAQQKGLADFVRMCVIQAGRKPK